jgi:hypothetical protein
MRKPIWWAAGAVILISAVVLFFSWRAHRLAQLPEVTPITPEAAAPAIRNPLPEGPGNAAPPCLRSTRAMRHCTMRSAML